MTTEEQNLNVEEKELVAVGASVGVGCCGCKPDGPNEGAPLEAQAPGQARETTDPDDAGAATTGPSASPTGFAESMNRRFASGGSAKTSGPSDAMAGCHRMFEQCMPGAAPAETDASSPASVAAGRKTQEV
jgi:hypothetical protein